MRRCCGLLSLGAALAIACLAASPAAALEWTRAGMAGIRATCIDDDPLHGRLFVGTLEGFHYLDLSSGEWTERDREGWIGRTVRAIAWHETEEQRVLTGRVNAFFKGYVELSEDLGQSEEIVYSSQAGAVNGFARAPLDVDRYYASTWHDITPGEILRSLDGGLTWTPLGGVLHYALTSITTGPEGTIYAGGDARVTRSTDGGDTWQLASGGLPEGYGIYCVEASRETDGLLLASSDLGLYRSEDGGGQWTRVSLLDCRSIDWGPVVAHGPGRPASQFAAAAAWNGAVLLSRDGGLGWEAVSGDLPGEAIDLAFSTADDYLYAATSAAGVFRTQFHDPASTGGQPVAGSGGPRLWVRRPLARGAALGFTLTRPGPARLEVFDSAGRRCAKLWDAWLPAGAHEIAWTGDGDGDGDRGGAGLFFARLQTAAGRSAARIVRLE